MTLLIIISVVYISDYITSVRALEVIALLFGAACIIVTGIWFFLHIQRHRLIMMIASLGTGFFAGNVEIVLHTFL